MLPYVFTISVLSPDHPYLATPSSSLYLRHQEPKALHYTAFTFSPTILEARFSKTFQIILLLLLWLFLLLFLLGPHQAPSYILTVYFRILLCLLFKFEVRLLHHNSQSIHSLVKGMLQRTLFTSLLPSFPFPFPPQSVMMIHKLAPV
jgi:hypothetical protein